MNENVLIHSIYMSSLKTDFSLIDNNYMIINNNGGELIIPEVVE